MSRRLALLLLVAPAPLAAQTGQACPEIPRYHVDQVDDYHGTRVSDPYRWLENADGDSTRQWVEAENCRTFAWLDQIAERDSLRRRLTRLWNYERFGLPVREGGRYFWTKNDGLQN